MNHFLPINTHTFDVFQRWEPPFFSYKLLEHRLLCSPFILQNLWVSNSAAMGSLEVESTNGHTSSPHKKTVSFSLKSQSPISHIYKTMIFWSIMHAKSKIRNLIIVLQHISIYTLYYISSRSASAFSHFHHPFAFYFVVLSLFTYLLCLV